MCFYAAAKKRVGEKSIQLEVGVARERRAPAPHDERLCVNAARDVAKSASQGW